MEEARQAEVYGVRPARTFEQAAANFVLENQHKRSIGDDVRLLNGLMPWIGSMPLDKVHRARCRLGLLNAVGWVAATAPSTTGYRLSAAS